jgi:hypothetical protein
MLRSAITIVIVLVLSLPTAAVVVAPLSFDQLVQKSAAVVLAQVTDVRGEFIADGRGVESVVTVTVLKGLKGSPGDMLRFTVPGGRAGRYLNLVPGAPTFAAGDVAVIFLTSRGARLPITTGLTQGVYRVRREGNEMLVMPPVIDGGRTPLVRGDAGRKPVSLSRFEASVRAIVDESASAPSALRRDKR